MNSDDIELLRRYAFERLEEALADLVRRHIGMVYSAAGTLAGAHRRSLKHKP
jgi:hypothetical protein